MSSEEQACLVRMHSDSENSAKLSSFGSLAKTAMAFGEGGAVGTGAGGETAARGAGGEARGASGGGGGGAGTGAGGEAHTMDSTDSGELIDCTEAAVLAHFHEDAIKQAGCGMAQVRVLLACALAMAGASLELAVVPFIMPSAEIELCILDNEKSWLGMISLLGVCLGALGWGCLADKVGRRRSLVSCLCVNAVFATIAAFMPTYGTFMTARLCSGMGSGGVVVCAYSYACETVSRGMRARAAAALPAGLAAGGALSALLAHAALPPTGRHALIENGEHFSAWHRYLLLCTLPLLASLVSLLWTPESPRFLLDAGREVDAMTVYQEIHSRNVRSACGGGGAAPDSGSAYRLGELELPAKRRPHEEHRFWQAWREVGRGGLARRTLALGGAAALACAAQYALAAYTPGAMAHLDSAAFGRATERTQHATIRHRYYNTSIENVVFSNVTFEECTFRDMFLSHVTFLNCTLLNVSFANVKTSRVHFKGTRILNSSIYDSDISPARDMDAWCALDATIVSGVRPPCANSPDLTSALRSPLVERVALSAAELGAAAAALLPARCTPLPVVLFLCVVCSPGLYFCASETALYTLEAIFRLLLTLAQYKIAVKIVETYPHSMRCTAHGLIMSLCYVAAMIATSSFSDLPASGYIAATLVIAALTGFATIFSLKVKDTSANLL